MEYSFSDRLRTAFEVHQIETGMERIVPVTLSIGIAAYPEHGNELETLIQASDQALYAAKLDGRNTVKIALE